MRLNPPITILAIVAAALGAMAALKYDPDCRFTPDGKQRYSSPIVAIFSWLAQGAQCDVWSSIEPKKPIETIELQELTSGGSHIVAVVDPLGSGYVAVVPPYNINHPIRQADDLSLAILSKYGTVYQIGGINPELYGEVKSLIGPMRDFQGGWTAEERDPVVRKRAGLDDLRTRIIQCRKNDPVMPPQYGPVIGFRFANKKDVEYVSLGVNCFDNAALNSELRNRKAIESLVQATGFAEAIRARGGIDYPTCDSIESKLACIIPRL